MTIGLSTQSVGMALNEGSKQYSVCKDEFFNMAEPLRRYIMRKFLSLMALGLILAAGVAQAGEPAKAAAPAAPAAAARPAAPASMADKKPQQSKMATCNKDAEGKKGDERKAFMSECLKSK